MGFPRGVSSKYPACQGRRCKITWVWSLGQEDPLEKGMATHSSILAWRIPWTEEPGGLQSTGSQRVRHDWRDLARTHTRFNLIQTFIWSKASDDTKFYQRQNQLASLLSTGEDKKKYPNLKVYIKMTWHSLKKHRIGRFIHFYMYDLERIICFPTKTADQNWKIKNI